MQFMSCIKPRCEYDWPQTFIEVNGFVSPCCWLVTDNNRIKMLKQFFKDDFDKLFLTNSSMKEIKQLYQKLKDTWETDTPFPICLKMCKNKDA